MGNSRVIFVGAVSIILGLYSTGLQKAERAVNRVGVIHSFQVQAEEIAKAGISLAIESLGTSKPSPLPSLSNLSIHGGTVRYVTDESGLASDEVRITSISEYQSYRVTKTAIVKVSKISATTRKKWANWEIVKVSTQFEAGQFAYEE
jgi:hypothetical protein